MSALRPGWLDEAPPSPVLPAWARAALASSPPREGPRSSPCPEAEQRAREVAAVGRWDVEEDSGPVTRRGAVLDEAMKRALRSRGEE